MPPSIVTSSLHPSNRDVIAWSHNGILAFGCHSTLVFLDARRLEVFQTLEQHATAINLVSWPPPSQLLFRSKADANVDVPPPLKCASSDISGNIFVWDVRMGAVLASFRHSTTPVTDLKWMNWPPSSSSSDNGKKDLPPLLSLHSNTWLICWHIGRQERIWEHKFQTAVFKISLDPFEPNRMALASTGCTLLMLDSIGGAQWSQTSTANFTADSPSSNQSSSTSTPSIQIHSMALEPRTIAASVAKSTTESAIVQLKHHSAFPHLLFVLFPNELCLVECQHRQVLYSASIDVGAPIIQILPCARRDALFLVHQNGLCSFRLANFHICEERMSASLDYERKCFADAMPRQSARLRVMSAALCPTTNSTLALLMNSGRVLFYQLEEVRQNIEPYRIQCIEDIVQLDPIDCQSKCPLLRLTQQGCYLTLSTTATVIRMRPIQQKIVEESDEKPKEGSIPAKTTTTSPKTQLDGIGQLAAVGTSVGIVHLVDVFAGKIVRDIQVHTFPVKCLEWAGHNAFVSAAYIASLSSSSTVRNDLFLTDIRTCQKRRIRPEQEESPVEAIRVSHYSSYLAISFRQHPLEIWDLGTQRLLRRMNKRCPIIVDMCWSGKHHQAKVVGERTRIYRENLVVLDNNNHLYHVVVKGLHVRDGKEVSTQWKSGAAFLRCMVWKEDVLAFGDSAGRIGIWDLARSQCRQSGLRSTRGPVHRIVFSKLTGDYTLATQHPTSIVIWDTEKLSIVFSIQRSGLSIIDVDMCGLTPVYLASDGMFRMALSSDNGKELNTSISDSETPLLLQPTYIEAIRQIATTTDSEKADTGISTQKTLLTEMDSDFDFLLHRIAQKPNSLQRLAFAHQFNGHSALANFCRVLDSAKYDQKGRVINDEGKKKQLPTDLLLFWSKEAYKKRMELLTRLLLSTSRNEQQLEQAIEKCIIMKKTELAMYYLLNNEQIHDASNRRETIRLNAFRACVLSANFDNEEAKCLVKLTATNLIAQNFVSEGIQLLCLIDQSLDACKYLISQGLWERSLLYSKINSNCEFAEIYGRYAEYLESIGGKSLALMILANLGGNLRKRERFGSLIEGTINAREIDRILQMAEE